MKSPVVNDSNFEVVETVSKLAVGHVGGRVRSGALALGVELSHGLAAEDDAGTT